MKQISITETLNPASENIDLMASFDIAKTINEEDSKVAAAIAQELPRIAQAIDMLAACIQNGGKAAYFGAGTSGRIGVLDASELYPTFGLEKNIIQGFIAGGDTALRNAVENAEDSSNLAMEDINRFSPRPGDVVIALSASGNPEYLRRILQEAKQRQAQTIAISSNPKASIAENADIFINPIVGPEVITGSSRMKSGTAQKMILNMLSTGAMVKIGKTYKNYMVDLKILNEKLMFRAVRFVSEITGLAPNEAKTYIEKSGKNVKIACVMAVKNCTKAEAETALRQAGGILRKVI